MSRPSKLILPAVGAYIPLIVRPRVDFPHPLSPTSPNVSPLPMSRLTSSTALRVRRDKRKCRETPRRRSCGSAITWEGPLRTPSAAVLPDHGGANMPPGWPAAVRSRVVAQLGKSAYDRDIGRQMHSPVAD